MTPRKETPIATRQAVINMRENGMRGTEIAMHKPMSQQLHEILREANWDAQHPSSIVAGDSRTDQPVSTVDKLSAFTTTTTDATQHPQPPLEMTASERLITTPNGSTNSNHANVAHPQHTVEYLSQLLKDKKQLAAFPNVFHHLERLADEEINKVRVSLFQFEFTKEEVALPEPQGEVTIHTEKIFVPAREYPDYNFVGRILGPRGMTAKQLEQETGCKIMVRGKGSMRDKKKEEMNRGKPNWEHLSEELHVVIQCEDTENRARVKLMRATEEVQKLLVPAPEGEDELKRKQLMELAIINGTYRTGADQNAALSIAQLAAAKQQPLAAALQVALAQQQQARGVLPLLSSQSLARSPTMAVVGAPIVMSPSGRTTTASAAATSQAALLFQQNQLQSQAGSTGLAAAQHAALLQQQAEYQQLLLNQGMYDLNAAAALQQQYALAGQSANGATAQTHSGLITPNQSYSDYAGIDITSQQSSGAMINNRRLLGASRDHPYKQ